MVRYFVKLPFVHVSVANSPTGGASSNGSPIMDILLNEIQPCILQKRLHDRDARVS